MRFNQVSACTVLYRRMNNSTNIPTKQNLRKEINLGVNNLFPEFGAMRDMRGCKYLIHTGSTGLFIWMVTGVRGLVSLLKGPSSLRYLNSVKIRLIVESLPH